MREPLGAKTISSLVADRARISPDAVALCHRAGAAAWQPITYAALASTVERLARGLAGRGLERGDRIAIFSRTRVEWLLVELAAMFAGLVVVGLDRHAPSDTLVRILDEAQPSALFVDEPSALAALPASSLAGIRLIVTGQPMGEDRRSGVSVVDWSELLAATGVANEKRSAFSEHDDAQSPAALLYTSGTTGAPKGILFRQMHLVVACQAILTAFPMLAASRGKTLCWLPMAPLFQRMMNYVALAAGVTIYFVEDPAEVLAVAREVRPTYLIAVPRLFEKLHGEIQQRLSRLPQPFRGQSLDRDARDARAGFVERVSAALVARTVRRTFGGRVEFVVTGSAPMPVWLLQYFRRCGVLLLEAYGLSENTVPIAANRFDAFRFGSVGKLLPENEVRFAEDGELLVRGPGLFDGYWSPAGIDTSGFAADGFFATGDVGAVDDDGFLYLTGRKSDVFKTSGGLRISPSKIEAHYRRLPYIDQIVVFGHGRPFVGALVRVNQRLVQDIDGDGVTSASDRRKLRVKVEADIAALGAELPGHERIRRFELLEHPFALDRGEMTPSLKLRRDTILRNYREVIDAMYGPQ